MSSILNTTNNAPTPEHGKPLAKAGTTDQAVEGVTTNVSDTKKSVTDAINSVKALASGEGNIADAGMAVKGAFDAVKGLSGKISESVMLPIMTKLAAFKGSAILPAGKQLDPVLGIDVHMVIIPPSPAPVPLPHPYVAIIFKPKDWVSCAINTFKKDIVEGAAKVAEGVSEGAGAAVAKHGDAAMSIVMGLAGLSASVKFGSFVPRAVTGTPTKNFPHIPFGTGWHPAFAIPIKKNHGKVFLGSLFVVADGDPMAGMFHLNYDCWDIGIIDLFKSRRKGNLKAPDPSGPQIELFVPSGTILAIPWGRPVLVNSTPTPINPLAILDKVFKAGLGKLKKAAGKAAAKILHGAANKVGAGNGVHKAICTVTGHPVDVASGMLFTDSEDFNLSGVIPLNWERTWYSTSEYKGPLGHGWHHNYDMAILIDKEASDAALRMADGRITNFTLPLLPNKPTFNRKEKLSLHVHVDGFYYVTDANNLI